MDVNYELKNGTAEREGSVGNFWGTHVSFGVIGGSDSLFRYSQEVGVEFAVGIFVVEDRDGVGSGLDLSEVAHGVLAGGDGGCARLSGSGVLGKAFRRVV